MKIFGIILVALGLALLVFIGYNFLNEHGRVISPVPENKGVKVIFVTPTK